MIPTHPLFDHAVALRDALNEDPESLTEVRREYSISRHIFRRLRSLARKGRLTVDDLPIWLIARTYV